MGTVYISRQQCTAFGSPCYLLLFLILWWALFQYKLSLVEDIFINDMKSFNIRWFNTAWHKITAVQPVLKNTINRITLKFAVIMGSDAVTVQKVSHAIWAVTLFNCHLEYFLNYRSFIIVNDYIHKLFSLFIDFAAFYKFVTEWCNPSGKFAV